MTRRFPAGDLDRRLQIQELVTKKDAAGDVLRTEWRDLFKLWAKRKPGAIGAELPTDNGVLRQHDVTWYVRAGKKSSSLAPEIHRVLYRGRVYEVVGILPGDLREDLVQLLTSSRPDKQGSRGDEGASGEP